MGFPERLVDRQLTRAKGDWESRVRTIRFYQNVMVAVIAISLAGVVVSFLRDDYDRRMSVVFVALWLAVAYVAVRQRRHLNSRMAQGS